MGLEKGGGREVEDSPDELAQLRERLARLEGSGWFKSQVPSALSYAEAVQSPPKAARDAGKTPNAEVKLGKGEVKKDVKKEVKKEESAESGVSGSAPSPPASPVLTAKDKAAIGQKYAGMSTDSFFTLPSIPFKHGSKDLVRFQDTLRRNIALCRVIAGDTSRDNWVPGWEMAIEKHVHRAVAARTLSLQEVGQLKEQLGSAFARFRERLEEGVQGPAAPEFLVRVLSGELSSVTIARTLSRTCRGWWLRKGCPSKNI